MLELRSCAGCIPASTSWPLNVTRLAGSGFSDCVMKGSEESKYAVLHYLHKACVHLSMPCYTLRGNHKKSYSMLVHPTDEQVASAKRERAHVGWLNVSFSHFSSQVDHISRFRGG